jgi:hypothetical protein
MKKINKDMGKMDKDFDKVMAKIYVQIVQNNDLLLEALIDLLVRKKIITMQELNKECENIEAAREKAAKKSELSE